MRIAALGANLSKDPGAKGPRAGWATRARGPVTNGRFPHRRPDPRAPNPLTAARDVAAFHAGNRRSLNGSFPRRYVRGGRGGREAPDPAGSARTCHPRCSHRGRQKAGRRLRAAFALTRRGPTPRPQGRAGGAEAGAGARGEGDRGDARRMRCGGRRGHTRRGGGGGLERPQAAHSALGPAPSALVPPPLESVRGFVPRVGGNCSVAAHVRGGAPPLPHPTARSSVDRPTSITFSVGSNPPLHDVRWMI